MGWVFADDFHDYSTAQLFRKWTSWNQQPDQPAINTGGTGPFGDNFLRVTPNVSTQNPNIGRSLGGNYAQLLVFFYFRISTIVTSYTILAIEDGTTTQVQLRVNGDGTLDLLRANTQITGGTSTNTIAPGTWYHIAVKVTIADSIGAGTAEVQVNGLDWLTVAAGQDTKVSSNAYANYFRIGRSAAGANNSSLLDFAHVGVIENSDFIGPVRGINLRPSGAGNSTQFTPSAGSNYQCVDETPAVDTDYVYSSTVGHKDLYVLPDLSVSPNIIHTVQKNILARVDDAGTRTANAVIRSNGADYDGSAFAPALNYLYYSHFWDNDPDTAAAWTESAVNALQAGPEVAS
jgi:hypothetical protein